MFTAKHIMLLRCTQFPSKKCELPADATARDVANRLISSNLPGVPIVNNMNDREIVGIVTEFNILGALREGMKLDEFTAERIMTKEPITADIDTQIEELIEIMLENNFTMIPITKNNRLLGIINRCSLMESYMAPGADRYANKQN